MEALCAVLGLPRETPAERVASFAEGLRVRASNAEAALHALETRRAAERAEAAALRAHLEDRAGAVASLEKTSAALRDEVVRLSALSECGDAQRWRAAAESAEMAAAALRVENDALRAARKASEESLIVVRTDLGKQSAALAAAEAEAARLRARVESCASEVTRREREAASLRGELDEQTRVFAAFRSARAREHGELLARAAAAEDAAAAAAAATAALQKALAQRADELRAANDARRDAEARLCERERVFAAEMAALGAAAQRHGLALHVDGARFANAVAYLGCTPWEACQGAATLSFGCIKNGAMSAEALVLFDESLAEVARIRRKRAGHLQSKGRFIDRKSVV